MLPHRVCLAYNPWLTAIMIIGDALTAISYLLIPIWLGLTQTDLKHHAFKSPNLVWNRYLAYLFVHERTIGTMFQAFIYACGAGHILKIVVLYHPVYSLQAGIDLWTGITSIATVVILFRIRFGVRKFLHNTITCGV